MLDTGREISFMSILNSHLKVTIIQLSGLIIRLATGAGRRAHT